MIKIIVDSCCDLPEELMGEYDIKSLPQRIYLNDVEYLDKVTISTEEVYEAMKRGVVPMTSLPAPADIAELFGRCCREGNNFIYIALSSKLSGTYQLAVSILKELEEQYEGIRMKAIDSKSASTATGLIALQAAKLAAAGLDFDIIVEQVYELADHIEHIFTVADLSWLIKRGRIGKMEGIIGNMLSIRPILQVKDGAAEVTVRVRGRKKALLYITDIVAERIKDFPDQTIGISHAGDLELVSELKDMLFQRLGEKDIIINKIGAALVSHLGIGGVGVFFFNKEPKFYIE